MSKFLPLGIYGVGCISPWGTGYEESSVVAATGVPQFQSMNGRAIGALHESGERAIGALLEERPSRRQYDRTVHLAMLAAHEAIHSAGWRGSSTPIGINIGSSRGATKLLEAGIMQSARGEPLSPSTSPLTTLGGIASAIAYDLTECADICTDLAFSHSITCSTAHHALLNACAWIQSGMAERFLVGGSEASLTPFTLHQMDALRIYSPHDARAHPCRPCAADASTNTFVLGEGAALFAIAPVTSQPRALISGFGCAFERAPTLTGMSADGDAFQRAMRAAVASSSTDIDAVVMHAPGTLKGDAIERYAISQVFGDIPCVNNKWMVGHTFGAAGALGILYALFLLDALPALPPYPVLTTPLTKKPKRIMVNAAGFGGNVVSVVIERP